MYTRNACEMGRTCQRPPALCSSGRWKARREGLGQHHKHDIAWTFTHDENITNDIDVGGASAEWMSEHKQYIKTPSNDTIGEWLTNFITDCDNNLKIRNLCCDSSQCTLIIWEENNQLSGNSIIPCTWHWLSGFWSPITQNNSFRSLANGASDSIQLSRLH